MQGDPYHCECHKTGRLLAEALSLKDDMYQVCFQSRFGKAEWLKPYFSDIIKNLGFNKEENVHVICPGFSSDCLETLEEINIEGKAIFKEHGGGRYSYIPALNYNAVWIKAMSEILSGHLSGWIDTKWLASKEKKSSLKTKQQYDKIKKNI